MLRVCRKGLACSLAFSACARGALLGTLLLLLPCGGGGGGGGGGPPPVFPIVPGGVGGPPAPPPPPRPPPPPPPQMALPYSLPITRCAPYLAGIFTAICFDQFRHAQQLPTAISAAAAKPGAPAGALVVEGSSGSLSAKDAGSLEAGEAASEGDVPVSVGCCGALAAVNWRRCLRFAADLAAVAAIVALVFIGVGANRQACPRV